MSGIPPLNFNLSDTGNAFSEATAKAKFGDRTFAPNIAAPGSNSNILVLAALGVAAFILLRRR